MGENVINLEKAPKFTVRSLTTYAIQMHEQHWVACGLRWVLVSVEAYWRQVLYFGMILHLQMPQLPRIHDGAMERDEGSMVSTTQKEAEYSYLV